MTRHFFTLLFATVFTLNSFAGLSPDTIKGLSQSTSLDANALRVPNAQVTKITGGTLVETGSLNVFPDPGAEGSATTTPFTTAVTDTATATASKLTDSGCHQGSKCYSLSCAGGASGGTCDFIFTYTRSNPARVSAFEGMFASPAQLTGDQLQFGYGQNGTVIEGTFRGRPLSAGGSVWESLRLGQILKGATSTSAVVRLKAQASQTVTLLSDDIKFRPDEQIASIQDVQNVNQSVVLNTSSAITATSNLDSFTKSFAKGGGLFSLGTDGVRPLRDIKLSVSFTVREADATDIVAGQILVNGTDISRQISRYQVAATQASNTGFTLDLSPSDRVTFITSANNTDSNFIVLSASASNPNTLMSNETFSFATNPLTFCSSATCTDEASLSNQPIGSFRTSSIASGGNARVNCSTAPTQTTASMQADGYFVTARPYTGAAGTCAAPTYTQVNVGKNWKGWTATLVKNPAATVPRISGNTQYFTAVSTQGDGFYSLNYDPSSGILTIDSGSRGASVTSSVFQYTNGTTANTGYILFEASKNPAQTATELTTFGAYYQLASAFTVPTAGTTFKPTVAIRDTNLGMNTTTGEYTVPYDGLCSPSASGQTAGVNIAVGARVFICAYQNSNIIGCGRLLGSGTAGATYNVSTPPITVPVKAGDKFSFLVGSDTATTFTTSATDKTAFISIDCRKY